ncbi:4-hydroxy-tetrahydrodipicolinate synthase [Planctomycetes bacterium Poly30]|uniref:4-hydroxy-tetrahydrodipicolinate synthase n=1 Tax=Saltatorellus ferox TaxID=2528018 RepID=A0A518EZC6_9BACT|nr:4-hydroxy-tetrahydrodipicolinate synthase [Planctomycetes bacterium Poly30]
MSDPSRNDVQRAEPGADPAGIVPLEGSIVALPTMFSSNALQLRDLDDLIRFQSRHTTTGVLVGGTAGEGWALSLSEFGRVVGHAAESAARHSGFRLHVYAAITDIDSRAARSAAVTAVHAGAEALFLCAPSFAQPRVEGLVRHFAYIAEGLPKDTPLVLLNEPKRTGTDLTPDLVRRICAEIPSFVAHCEGVGQPARARSLASQLPVPVLCGDDRMIGPYMRSGAAGAVSVVGGIVPAEVARLILEAQGHGVRANRIADALERSLNPLIDTLRVAPCPVALKETLLALDAIRSAEVRAPLASLGESDRRALERSLTAAKLLVPALS